MRNGCVWAAVLFLLAFLFAPARSAAAERDLAESQPAPWYGVHGGTLGALSLASVGVLALWPDASEPRWQHAPDFERFTEANLSKTTRIVSDVALLSNIGAPFVTFTASGSSTSYGNASLVYGETLSITILANQLTKRLALRARPYTHSDDALARSHVATQGADVNYSFYSGHAAGAFTSAVAGSFLFDATVEGEVGPALHWGFSLAVAGLTAHARVRAGQHYPTDVVVGSLLGAGVGVLVPALHRVDPKMSPAAVVAAGSGVLAGVGLAFLLPKSASRKLGDGSLSVVPLLGGGTVSWRGNLVLGSSPSWSED